MCYLISCVLCVASQTVLDDQGLARLGHGGAHLPQLRFIHITN